MRMSEGANAKMRTNANRAAQFAWAALLACTGVVIAAGFALTFHGIYGFGRDIAHWGPALAALGPIADDGLTLVAIAATFLLAHAHAPRRPRVYAWFVFAVACAASVAGNTAYAMRPLPTWVGAIGAALCPVFVTLAAHLGVVCWRHSQPRAVLLCVCGRPHCPVPSPVECLCGQADCGHCTARTSKPRSPASAAPPAHTSPAPVAGHPEPASRARPAKRASGGPRRTTPQQKTRALALLAEDKRPAEVALAVGVSKRLVEMWRKERDDQQKSRNDQEGEVS
jgi:hypothetical protein